MSDEKLELIKMLSQYDKEEMQQIMIIMTYWEDMIKDCIVDTNDIDNISELSQEKQQAIKDYVSKRLQEQIERNNNGTKE